ncbi:MAG TPA: tetratricopeptide repeat protein, partial [Candidatus Aquicultoraceae bacterium]|nr:tetratricopeptide repeat protein [Candidatus Aquicultoraceae bacterium]
MGGRIRACVLLLSFLLLSPGAAASAAGNEVDRGAAQVRAGEYAAAEATLRGVLETDPGNREARIWLARALSFSGDFGGGEREYRRILSGFPGDVEARLGLADVLAWQKRYREAGILLDALAEERPGDPEVLARRRKVAFWAANVHSREAEAGASYLRIRRASPGSQVHFAFRDRSVEGWEFLGRGDYLHRFGKDEGRATGGVTRRWRGGRALLVETSLSPGAEVFARASLEAELAWPVGRGLVGYAGGKYAHYSIADAWNGV